MAVNINTDAEITSIRLDEQVSAPTPDTGYSHIFAKADGLYIVDDDAVVTGPFATGGGGDVVATLVNAEVSVTGTATLTSTAFTKMHVCSGTAANYTVTLPAVSGNGGKTIGFRMATGLTRLVTIDGNGAETIDGVASRIMWAHESATLLCDGTTWIKIAGKSIPMTARMKRTTAQTITTGTWTQIVLTTVDDDNTSGLVEPCADSSNGYFVVRRPGYYTVSGVATLEEIDVSRFAIGGVSISAGTPDNHSSVNQQASLDNVQLYVSGTGTWNLAVNETPMTVVYHNRGSNADTRTIDTVRPTLQVIENISW